ncbi:MAG TPA: FAD binding domain-containing protein, partial [Anaerolineae bacterium]|nr:FAD binding domain-containing protein [Anaerolineae bacterium]
MLARLGLPRFDYVIPGTIDEALRLLHKHGQSARPLMGGTDLFVRMRDGFLQPEVVINLKSLPLMRTVSYDARVGLTIGAAVTMITSWPRGQAGRSGHERCRPALSARPARRQAKWPGLGRALSG